LTTFPDSTPERPHRGVEVRPPDVNLSEARFSVVFMPDEEPDACHGHVRFGLGAIRGVSSSAIAAIIAERAERGPFESIFDFCERVNLGCVNRATIEALVKSGAFDSLHDQERRAAVFAALGDAIAAGQGAAADRRSGQLNFLASMAEEARHDVQHDLPSVAPWDRMHTLSAEKEVLGFHVSGHPLDLHAETLGRWATTSARGCAELADKTEVRLGGILAQVRTRIVRNGRSAGQKMALCSVQDKTGAIEGVIFSDAYARYGDLLANDAIVAVTGRLDRVRGEPSVVVDQVLAIEDLPRHLAGGLELDLVAGPEPEADEMTMQRVERLLRRAGAANGGRQVGVMLNVLVEGKRVALKPHAVVPEDALLTGLRNLLGDDHVRVVARKPART
ncbi:MAG: helix-hairpin-helix domain-containing protein, partial [Planctomycetota bacterium]